MASSSCADRNALNRWSRGHCRPASYPKVMLSGQARLQAGNDSVETVQQKRMRNSAGAALRHGRGSDRRSASIVDQAPPLPVRTRAKVIIAPRGRVSTRVSAVLRESGFTRGVCSVNGWETRNAPRVRQEDSMTQPRGDRISLRSRKRRARKRARGRSTARRSVRSGRSGLRLRRCGWTRRLRRRSQPSAACPP